MDLFNSITNKVKDIIPNQAEELLTGLSKETIIKFIMDKIKDGKQSEANKLVNETLAKHETGKLDSESTQGFIKNISSLVKPEYANEVKNFVTGFLNKGK